jgi:hypothetical protein
MTDQTLGEKRVRVSFNPSHTSEVDKIKMLTAELIDMCNDLMIDTTNNDQARCAAIAMTHYEEAAMWAVKAATTGK